MKEDVFAYFSYLNSKGVISQSELFGARDWIAKYYDGVLSSCITRENRNECLTTLSMHPDNVIAVLSFVDICDEYNDNATINSVINNKEFKHCVPVIEQYLYAKTEVKKNGKRSSNGELRKDKEIINSANNSGCLMFIGIIVTSAIATIGVIINTIIT